MSEKQFELLYSAEKLQQIVKDIALSVNLGLPETQFPQPIFVGVLSGSFMFMGDLMKEVYLDCEIDFVEAKSYRDNKKGLLAITKDVYLNVEGRNVVLVEDIIDTGDTIKKLKNHFTTVLKAKRVVVVSLLARKRLLLDLPALEYYIGDYIEDEAYVVGYGLDDNGKARNVPEIFIKNV
jgi:hypoxanthine phosphoribosyltransferase